jgi:uncharacterized OB-fold protein
METLVTGRIPLVEYLALEPTPHLVANECTSCGARFFDQRTACAGCSGLDFAPVDIAPHGEVASFTIVTFAPPGVPAPYVAAIVDCEGTWVRANLVEVDPDPEKIWLGMKVRLATYSLGTDSAGTEGVGFGFAPAE